MSPTICRYIEHYGAQMHVLPRFDGKYAAVIFARQLGDVVGNGETVQAAMKALDAKLQAMEDGK